ncbi:hypothetical protein ACTZWW_20925 [Salinarimonas sp. NSM]|uniref:hypothetical protein n=1 Tax=Salinarimonas sp. NSM TaxID=3458003 RepID=UPI004035A118
MIRIFGARTDPHVGSVSRHLETRGHPFALCDIYDPTSDGLDIVVDADLALRIQEPAPPGTATTVWWRVKPPFVVRTESLDAYYDQQFASREWRSLFDLIAEPFASCRWVNPLPAASALTSKFTQLRTARALGIPVPRTLFSTRYEAVLAFVEENDRRGRRTIVKTITPYISPSRQAAYATAVDVETVRASRAEIESCPSIYQEAIEPRCELRITVVGSDLFAVEISGGLDAIDWRRRIDDDIYHATIADEPLAAAVRALHDAFGLAYGAYDFIVDRDGRHVFLEVNPMGQWVWLEEATGLGISAAVADLLAITPTRD